MLIHPISDHTVYTPAEHPVPAQHPTTALAIQTPTVSTNVSALAFEETAPGEVRFLVIRVSQHFANTVLTLSTDAPDQFQLASDAKPTFTANLTLAPSPTGTYVHVRYAPAKTGSHTGHLSIESPYASLTIELSGRSNGLASALRRVRATDPLLTTAQPSRLRRLGLAVAILGAAGIGYAVYEHQRKALPGSDVVNVAPRPTRNETPVADRTLAGAAIPERRSEAVRPRADQAGAARSRAEETPTGTARRTARKPLDPARNTAVSSAADRQPDPVPVQPRVRIVAPEQAPPTVTDQQPTRVSGSRRETGSSISRNPANPKVEAPIPAQPTGESELERELNKRKSNQ